MQKTAKKVCSLLLALVLILGMLPISALATESGTTQWVGTDLQLGEDLTLRFYANISAEHATDGVMTVTVDGQTYETFTVSEMTVGDNGYVFPVALGAAQMTAQVKLTLVSGGQTVLEKTSSIRDYADAILAGKYTEELKSLVKWMLNYGAAAQGYFGVNTGNPANAGYELESNQAIPEESPATDVSDKLSGVSFYGVSMVFRSKIALRFYFTVSGSGSYTYTCNGKSCEAVEKDGMFYVEAPDLNPQAMDAKVQVVVSDGSKSLTVSYSPMDYITRMYRKDSSSDALKTMLTYAADYFDAAEDYVNGTEENLVVSDTFAVGAYGEGENFTIDLSDYNGALKGYTLSGAAVNGTAFTSASYADGVVALDRAAIQALSGEQTLNLTFSNGQKTINVPVNVELYTMAIGTAEDLQAFPAVMKANPTGHYVLTNDIDMNGVAYSNDATVPFAGTFDGRGYTIYNMNAKASSVDMHGGFFGQYFGADGSGVEVEGAVLKNISFVNATVWGRGSFLAMMGQGAVENVYLRVNIQDLFADVNDPNPWYNSTSVLFNVAYWDVELKNVIVEYNEALTNNNGWGYALGQIYGSNCESNFFVVGADAFAAAGLSMPETDLGTAGYYIVTSNDNVFIMTGKETGAQNAVLAFLKHVVGMEVYGVDTVVFTKTGETMPDMVIIEKPDIPNHMMGNWRGYYETAGELSGRYLLGYTHFSHQFLQKDGADNHTSMLYLPYNTYGRSVLLGGKGHSKWYSKRGLFQAPSQLCYNAQGDADELAAMVDEAAAQILNELNKAENAAITMGQFSIMDNEDCCNCDACKADLAKYGSNNGAVVEFMNLLSAEIQERLQAQADEAGTAKREFTLYLMAYNAYEDAPSMNLSEIHFHENLGVIYAPIGASYTHSFYESQNADVATNMRNWATLSDHLYYWLYETNFRHYMIPHDSWTTSVENLRFAYECDADIVMIQGQHNQAYATGFTALKVYLNSVAGQNVNAMNDGGYQRAVNSFFANYYGKGGNEMQQLFEELQAWMNGLSGQYTGQINSSNCDALADAAFWPKDMLVSWLSLVEKAETDAAGDAKALKHIQAEGIFIRYMLIEFYGSTYSASELAAMKSSFKEDCAALGIVKATEFDNVADLWS